MKKAKTHLLRTLQQAFALARKSRQTGKPADELVELERIQAISRKNFIKHTAMATVAIGASSLLDSCKKDSNMIGGLKSDPKIGIVGAGIAGLHAAYILKKAGFYSHIYEASNRAGGRMFSKNDILAPGLTTEFGAEFIDSDHEDMISLAAELGLTLLDRQSPSETVLTEAAFYFNNHHYSMADVVAQASLYVDQLDADYAMLPGTISYHNPGTAVNLDVLSIAEYLDTRGFTGWFRSFIEKGYVAEYGLESGDQSCINLVFLIGTDISGGTFNIYGSSDERYKVQGGNQQIPLGLAQKVPEINYGFKLESISKSSNKFTLGFSGGKTLDFDYVIIAIPFTVLRNVDIKVALPVIKKQSIFQLGYGTNAKAMAGFNSKVWRDSYSSQGYTFTDQPFLEGWDNSQLLAGSNGGYTFFLSGDEGKYANLSPLSTKMSQYLQQLDNIFPGAAAQYNGNSALMHWPTSQYVLGSYACYRPGQSTSIGGAEFENAGNLYFAGEHCSYDFQGYMNGGAETGRRAAQAILQKMTA